MDTKNISSPFQLRQNNVLEFKFSNNEGILVNGENIKRVYDVDYDIVHIWENKESHLGIVELTIQAKRLIENNDKKFQLKLRVNGIFLAPLDMPKETFTHMLELNGVAALYNIARGKISSLSSLCYPSEPVTIPMINVNKLVEQHNQKSKT